MNTKMVRCIVACTNSQGTPELVPVVVECTQAEYDEGDHYDAARDHVTENGYEGDFVVFDENDKALIVGTEINLFDLVLWDNADTTASREVQKG